MANQKKFYLGRRDNPQLTKPYYKAYGQLSVKEAKAKEKCVYGSMTVLEYTTEDEYNTARVNLLSNGFSVKS